jgi:hypothetical protein
MLSAISCKQSRWRALPGLPTYPAQAVSIRPKKFLSSPSGFSARSVSSAISVQVFDVGRDARMFEQGRNISVERNPGSVLISVVAPNLFRRSAACVNGEQS